MEKERKKEKKKKPSLQDKAIIRSIILVK